MWARIACERRKTLAVAYTACANLSGYAVGRNSGNLGTLPFLARRATLRIPRRTDSSWRDPRELAAQACRTRSSLALSFRRPGRRIGARQTRIAVDRRDALRG